MSLSQDVVEALIGRIYEAALDPTGWNDVVVETSRAIGASSGTALWFDGGGTRLLMAVAPNLDPEAVAAYDAHYVRFCPRLRLSARHGPGQVYDDRRVRARGGPLIEEYYAFVDGFGCGLATTLLVERDDETRFGLNFYRPVGEWDDAAGLRLLRALAPHARRAGRMTLRAAEMVGSAAWGEELFELSSPLMLLDADGRVRRMNARAGALLGDGLRLIRGQLRAARGADDVRLQAEIAAALNQAPPDPGFVLVQRPSGRPAWAVSALPLGRGRRGGFTAAPVRAVLSISETVPRVEPAALRRGWGLSRAEAEVAAALARGLTIDSVAEARRASVETVRGQVKAVLSKVGVSTQAQLVGRVAAACGTLQPPRET